MRYSLLSGGVFAAVFLFSHSAFAYCAAPRFFERMPDPPGSYDKPDVPLCLKDRDRECSDRDIDEYERNVQDYIRKLETYVNESIAYANDAGDHAGDAKRYAECEVRDVNAQVR